MDLSGGMVGMTMGTSLSLEAPSPDLQSILARHAPARCCQWCTHRDDCRGFGPCDQFAWRVDLGDYERAGQEIVEARRYYTIALGLLFAWGYHHLRQTVIGDDGIPLEGVTQWAEYCARLWGCSRATIFKALEVAEAHATTEIPADTSDTLVYEVKAGLADGEALDEALDAVLGQGLSTWQVRVLKQLRSRGMVTGWQMPSVVWTRDNHLVVRVNGSQEVIGRFTTNLSDLARAGMYMLVNGTGIRVEKEKE